MFKKNCILLIICLLSSCAQVDDYILGKDNTPQPSELKPVKSKVKMNEKRSALVGKPAKTAVYLKLKPVIQNGIIYTADSSGLIQALEQSTLKPLWSQHLSHSIVSGPTVKSGYIAVGTDSSTVVLLNQANGKKLWETSVSSDVLSKPVIAHNKVVVKTIGGRLYALNIENGTKQWVAEHGAPGLMLKASSTPVVLDQVVLVGFSDGKLDAIDLNTGATLWQRSIAYASGASDVERLVDIDADPLVRDNIAYLATYQGYIGALSLKDGQFLWRKPASTYKNIVMNGDSVFMTDSDDVIWAFNRKNGQVQWKQPALKARNATEPVLLGNRLIIGDKTGFLHVLSTNTGDFLSRTHLNSPIYSTPSVSGNNVYVMTANGYLNELVVS